MRLEIGSVMLAAADRARGNAGLLGDDTGGELLGRHFEREEADDAAIDALRCGRRAAPRRCQALAML